MKRIGGPRLCAVVCRRNGRKGGRFQTELFAQNNFGIFQINTPNITCKTWEQGGPPTQSVVREGHAYKPLRGIKRKMSCVRINR